MSFSSLGLSEPITRAVTELNYSTPSPIQEQAIPAIIQGRDIMAAAQTGTGKTAGFTLPLLERLSKGQPAGSNQARALVLTPTRELAAQVGQSVAAYSKYLRMRSTVVYGGVKINPQMMALRKGADVLVATPGRLLDLHQQRAVRFDQLEVLVLDEADRMLDMGFIHDLRKILALLPPKRQTLMFSATFSDDIRQLAKSFVSDPVEVSVTPRNTTAETVKQWIVPVDKKRKPALLCKLISEGNWHQVLVFSRTKHGANKLTKQLSDAGITAAAIHGNKSQGARTRALSDFKQNKVRALVATDIAARGLDISQLPQVVNFDLPNVPEDYVHRIGRTGRAGASGHAVSLVSADEFDYLCSIERLIKSSLERREVEGFEPDHVLPEGRPISTPHKPRKPRPAGNGNGNQRAAAKPGGNRRRGNAKSGESGRNSQGNRDNSGARKRPSQAGNSAGNGGGNASGKPASSRPANGNQKAQGGERKSSSTGRAAPRSFGSLR